MDPQVTEHPPLPQHVRRRSRSYNLPSSESRMKQFLAEAAFVVNHRKLPAIYWRESRDGGHEDWVPFLSLATRVMSSSIVAPAVSYWFQSFLSVIPALPEKSLFSLSSALQSEYMAFGTAAVGSETVKSILTVIESHTRGQNSTVRGEQQERAEHPASRILVRYDGGRFADLPTVKTFLESDMMEMKMIAPATWDAAEIVVNSFKQRLPRGVQVVYRREGNGGVITLRKPFGGQGERNLDCETSSRGQEICKKELEIVGLPAEEAGRLP